MALEYCLCPGNGGRFWGGDAIRRFRMAVFVHCEAQTAVRISTKRVCQPGWNLEIRVNDLPNSRIQEVGALCISTEEGIRDAWYLPFQCHDAGTENVECKAIASVAARVVCGGPSRYHS